MWSCVKTHCMNMCTRNSGRGTKSEIICHYLLKSSAFKSRKRLGHIYADRHRPSESHFANLNYTISQDSKTHFIQAHGRCLSPFVQCKSALLIKVSCSVLWLLYFLSKTEWNLGWYIQKSFGIQDLFQLGLELYIMLFQKYQISQIFVQY